MALCLGRILRQSGGLGFAEVCPHPLFAETVTRCSLLGVCGRRNVDVVAEFDLEAGSVPLFEPGYLAGLECLAQCSKHERQCGLTAVLGVLARVYYSEPSPLAGRAARLFSGKNQTSRNPGPADQSISAIGDTCRPAFLRPIFGSQPRLHRGTWPLPTRVEPDVLPQESVAEIPTVRTATSAFSPSRSARLLNVDILRGIAMILMALDHTRSFLTGYPVAPEDLAHSSATLFFTRWITHFCAPIFFLLAGTAAYLSLWQGRSRSDVSRFLWTRGLWLIVLDLTVIGYGWTSEFVLFSGVLWSIGWSMIALSLLIRLPVRWVGTFGAVVVFGHNLLDSIRPENLGNFAGPLWLILHGSGAFWVVRGKIPFTVLWPIIPGIGVMAVGYALGALLMRKDWRKWTAAIGTGATALFCILRWFNLYGNSEIRWFGVAAGPWSYQRTTMLTVASFLNTLKYPSSLQYLLMTLGPSLLALVWLANIKAENPVAKFVSVFGRVPLFYYVLHLYLIHFLAFYVALIFKQNAVWLLYGGFMTSPAPPGYGHGLPFVYAMTGLAVLILYPMCLGFMRLKQRHPDWAWLRYF